MDSKYHTSESLYPMGREVLDSFFEIGSSPPREETKLGLYHA